MRTGIIRLAIAATALPMLSGCVAALVPLAASGALFGNEAFDNDEDGEVVAEVTVRDAENYVEIAEVVSAPSQPAPELAAPIPSEPVSKPAAEPVELAAIETKLSTSGTLIGPVDDEPPQQMVAAAEETPAPAALTPELARDEEPQPQLVAAPAEALLPAPAMAAPDLAVSADVSDAEVQLAEVETTAIVPPAATPAVELAPAEQTAEMAALPESSASVPPTLAADVPPAPITPAARPSATTLPFGPLDFRAYDVMYNYVEQQSRRNPTQIPRQSALLAAPGSLSPLRTECSIRPPAVVVDLDPGEQVFDPAIDAAPNPALSQMLASLRLQEVEVFWISEITAVKAGAVRKALVDSGMDAQGRDQLLLMRRVGDRKQTRRRELAETHCLLAIAGDSRADFDELFLYLRDKSAAQPLEELIGEGWFLTPLPLNAATAIER